MCSFRAYQPDTPRATPRAARLVRISRRMSSACPDPRRGGKKTVHRVVCIVVRATTLGAFWGAVLVGCMAAPRSSSVSQDAETQHIEAKGSRVDGLLEAENRRKIEDVTDDDLGNHDPRVRRQAARALSR